MQTPYILIVFCLYAGFFTITILSLFKEIYVASHKLIKTLLPSQLFTTCTIHTHTYIHTDTIQTITMCRLVELQTKKATIIPSKQNENKLSELTKTTAIALIANYFVKNILPELYSKNILLYSVYLTILFIISRELKSIKCGVGIFVGTVLSALIMCYATGTSSSSSPSNLGLIVTVFLSTFGFLIGYISEKINFSEVAQGMHEVCMTFNNCMDCDHEHEE